MGAAEAMGTFVKVWRSEWAGLSRAQLAIAVSACLPKRKAVTPRVVLYWEEGHPPGSTEELEALCDVMQRNYLLPAEVEDFRRAVFAACLDRQYPELFPGEDWLHQDGLEAAAALHCQEGAGVRLDRVHLVNLTRQLHSVVSGRSGEAVDPARRRDRLAALAYLQRLLNLAHSGAGRQHVSAITYAQEAAFLDTHFDGKGPHASLTSAMARAHAIRDRAVANETPEGFWGILEVLRDARAAGETHDANDAFTVFVGVLDLGTPDQRDYARNHAAEHVAVDPSSERAMHDHNCFCRGALRDGLLGEAERHLEGFQAWEHHFGLERRYWAQAMGEFALASGRRDEASRYFETALEVARRLGDVWTEQAMLDRLEGCERPYPSASKGPAKRTGDSSRNGGSAAGIAWKSS